MYGDNTALSPGNAGEGLLIIEIRADRNTEADEISV
mgnify:CR=1 FL=1